MTMQVHTSHGAETVSSESGIRTIQGHPFSASPLDKYHMVEESPSYIHKISRLERDTNHLETTYMNVSMSDRSMNVGKAQSPPASITIDLKVRYSSPEDRYQHASERKDSSRSDRDNDCSVSPVTYSLSVGHVSPTSVACAPETFESIRFSSEAYQSRIEEQELDGTTRARGAFEDIASAGPLWYDPFARHGRKFVRKPRVTFPDEVVTKIRSVPRWEASQKPELFYTPVEYMQFREEVIYHHEATWENVVVDYCSEKWNKLQQVFGCKAEVKEEDTKTSDIKS